MNICELFFDPNILFPLGTGNSMFPGYFFEILVIVVSSLTLFVVIAIFVIMKRKNNQAMTEVQQSRTELEALKIVRRQLKESEDALNMHLSELQTSLDDANARLQKSEKLIVNLREQLNSNPEDGRFPICAHCKDIRDDRGFWHPIEEYIQNLSDTDFSHSLCPDCAKKLYPDLFKDGNKPITLTWKQ